MVKVLLIFAFLFQIYQVSGFATEQSSHAHNSNLTHDKDLAFATNLVARAEPRTARVQQRAPRPKAWYNQWVATNLSKMETLPRMVVFVESLPEGPGFPAILDFNAAGFNQLSWIKTLGRKDFEFFQNLNPSRLDQATDFEDPSSWYKTLMQVTNSRLIVATGQSKDSWELYTPKKLNASLDSIQKIKPKTQPESLEPSGVLNWLVSSLGYDGIVLDSNGPMLLIALLRPSSNLKQGLLLLDSHETPHITGQNQNIGALFQVRRIEQDLLIAEILLERNIPVSIPTGTKVVFGR